MTCGRQVPVLRGDRHSGDQSVIGRTEDECRHHRTLCKLGIFAGIEPTYLPQHQARRPRGLRSVASYKLVRRAVTKLPVIAKPASPANARAKAVKKWRDAISMVNAPRAICIDYPAQAVIGNKIGSLSGQPLLPAVYDLGSLVRASDLWHGAGFTLSDVIEFMAAGAALSRSEPSTTSILLQPRALNELSLSRAERYRRCE